jgi:hypothetical protein
MNIPCCILALVGVQAFLHLSNPHQDNPVKLLQLDWFGYVVFGGALTSFLLGIASGGIDHPWSSPAIIVPIILGICGLVLFALIEIYAAKDLKTVSFAVFANRTARIAMFDSFAGGFVNGSCVYYLAIYVRSTLLWET